MTTAVVVKGRGMILAIYSVAVKNLSCTYNDTIGVFQSSETSWENYRVIKSWITTEFLSSKLTLWAGNYNFACAPAFLNSVAFNSPFEFWR
jgi:hypothetical protein